jgi:hypothetical protein
VTVTGSAVSASAPGTSGVVLVHGNAMQLDDNFDDDDDYDDHASSADNAEDDL